ncbi:sulfotransferase family protein [Pelagibius marinus]|uniref:sulfotransferase family protein n=1 Tax=Pelagibius marinus TaxID=2762760 RepID=UPI001872512B|nr:sulfotransferase family protein [Pelagibius marinus]
MLVVLPEHRVVYTVVPKAANSTIKRFLVAACGEVLPAADAMVSVQRGSLLPDTRKFSSRELHTAINDSGWFRFTFVRNPYDRLVSVYKDKVIGLGTVDTGLQYVKRLDPEASGAIPFRDFVQAVCDQKDEDMDAHWRPQASLIMSEAISYSHIGHVENFARDMEPVVRRLALPAELVEQLGREPINPTRKASLEERFAPSFDAELADTVFRRYRRDFELFGYAPDCWQTQSPPSEAKG